MKIEKADGYFWHCDKLGLILFGKQYYYVLFSIWNSELTKNICAPTSTNIRPLSFNVYMPQYLYTSPGPSGVYVNIIYIQSVWLLINITLKCRAGMMKHLCVYGQENVKRHQIQ